MTHGSMPDYTAKLEGELRRAVRRQAARSASRRAVRRTVVVTAVVAAGIVVIASGAGPSSTEVRAAVPLLKRPTVDASALRHDLPEAVVDAGRLDQARAVAVPGGTAYFIPKSGGGWCVTGPDPATDDPQREYASTCVSDVTFGTRGITLRVGTGAQSYLVSAPPAGASAPTVTAADGTPRDVRAADGVALVTGIEAGDTVVTHDSDDRPHESAVPHEPQRPTPSTAQDCGGGRIVPSGSC